MRSDRQRGFQLLPKPWIVDRALGRLQWGRRLSKNYEGLPETSEAFIYLAMIRLIPQCLA